MLRLLQKDLTALHFALDHRLAESSRFVEDWGLCRVMLKNDKTLPWLYLIPRVENAREIFDLSIRNQSRLAHEMGRAGYALQKLYNPDKINTAALGNMVPQLHVHIFGRFQNDPAWPRPIWAVQPPEIPYTDYEMDKEIAKIKKVFQTLKREGRAA